METEYIIYIEDPLDVTINYKIAKRITISSRKVYFVSTEDFDRFIISLRTLLLQKYLNELHIEHINLNNILAMILFNAFRITKIGRLSFYNCELGNNILYLLYRATRISFANCAFSSRDFQTHISANLYKHYGLIEVVGLFPKAKYKHSSNLSNLHKMDVELNCALARNIYYRCRFIQSIYYTYCVYKYTDHPISALPHELLEKIIMYIYDTIGTIEMTSYIVFTSLMVDSKALSF